MRCPYCTGPKTMVCKTERPLDEGFDEGQIKKRTRKCRSCARNFVTFEVYESIWRHTPITPPLIRKTLLNEAAVAHQRSNRRKPRLG